MMRGQMNRWMLGLLIGWLGHSSVIWSQQSVSGPVPLVPIAPPFFGSAQPWWIHNNIVNEIGFLWNSLGFGFARQHMIIPMMCDWNEHMNAFEHIFRYTGASFVLLSADFDIRMYGGVPWSTSGAAFLENFFFKRYSQQSYVTRTKFYGGLSEPDAGWYRGFMFDANTHYMMFSIDSHLARSYLPGVKIGMPAPNANTRGGWDHMESMLKRGFLNLADYTTLHPYRNTSPESLVPVYANMRSLIASYARSPQIPPLVAEELGCTIEAMGRPTPNEQYNDWRSLLDQRDWRIRRWAKHWQRLFLIQRYCDVPLFHAYQWLDWSTNSWDALYFALVVEDVDNNHTIHKLLSYYSVQNFIDFYMLYEHYARVYLPDKNQWLIIYRARKPSARGFPGLRRNEWLLVAWDRYSRGGQITLPIYGATGKWYNFIGKAGADQLGAEQGNFSFSTSQPLTLVLYTDPWDNPGDPNNPGSHVPDTYPLFSDTEPPTLLPHDGSPFYYVLERFDARRSLPEIAWRVTEHATVRAGGVLRLRVEGYCPREWGGHVPDRAYVNLAGRGVNLTASFPVEAGEWFSREISLPWNGRRAAVELVASLMFGSGSWVGRPLEMRRVVWVSVSNPIDCRLAPMKGGLGVLLRSRDFSAGWSGKVQVDIVGVGLVERNVSLTAGGSQVVRIFSTSGSTADLTINSIRLIDSSNQVVAEWGRRYVDLLWSNLPDSNSSCSGDSLPLWYWTWDSSDNTPDDRPNPEGNEPNRSDGNLECAEPPATAGSLPFVDDGNPVQVAKLRYRFGCTNADRPLFLRPPAQAVVVSHRERVQIPHPSQRVISEICVWLYATEPWLALSAGVYDNDAGVYENDCGEGHARDFHSTSTAFENTGQWQLVSFYLPHLRLRFYKDENGDLLPPCELSNTEYISSTSVDLNVVGIANVYSAGPGELYIGPFAMVHYEEEEL